MTSEMTAWYWITNCLCVTYNRNSPTPSSPELSVALRVGSLRFLPSMFVCLLVLSLFGPCVGSHTAVLRYCGWRFPAIFRRHNSQQTLWLSPLLQCFLSFRYRTYIVVLSIYGAWRLHDGLFSAFWPAVAFCDSLFLFKRSFFGEGVRAVRTSKDGWDTSIKLI